jgi:predicted amidohydrolase
LSITVSVGEEITFTLVIWLSALMVAAGRTADRISYGSSAITDANGTILRVGEEFSEDILVAEVHAVE